jgi:hypothetical protein
MPSWITMVNLTGFSEMKERQDDSEEGRRTRVRQFSERNHISQKISYLNE